MGNLLGDITDRFGAILIDPPWRFANRTGKVAPEHKRLRRYRTMSFAEIEALPVEAMTDLWHDRGAPANAGPAVEDAGLAIWCDEMPGNLWTIQLPEAMGSMERPAASFRPVVRQAWEPGLSGNWGYSGATWQQTLGQTLWARWNKAFRKMTQETLP